ncbi:DUF2194 domain-containing protein [Mobilitalea sibirica]|uniref:DUF2194 domain-containing protein n=1 Tax=Mobilitalea sibirica TaxID=1462919 RepID=A0A8J7L303_9FIRM|nr:DUF2194 domain-containing protein [Mobilitalea sibirica]MBH1941528.1 DUF2194 domain-containing protein [Mobilitalea sibirica]
MLSTKRLILIIIIITTISIAFLLFNVSNYTTEPTKDINTFQDELILVKTSLPETMKTDIYYIVGDAKDEYEKNIITNVKQALSYMKLKFSEKIIINEDDLIKQPILIICTKTPSKVMDLKQLANYISNGGKVLFAAGLPEGSKDSYLYPIWGIMEKGTPVETKQLHINRQFMPYPEITFDYSGYNSSSNLTLNPSVNVLMEDTNKVPMIYSHGYERGKVVVINGSLMDNISSGGFFSSALGELKGDLIYPVIGVKTVYLDEFPPIQSMDDIKSNQLYGRGAESFLRDVLWPELLRSSSRYDIKYTAGILSFVDKENNLLLENERLTKYLLKEILRYHGEVILQGDFSNSSSFRTNLLSHYYNEFKRMFPNYKISGYSVLYGKTNQDILKTVSEVLGGIYTVRGFYQGDETTQTIQKFEVKDSFVHYPVISSGFSKSHGMFYEFLSGLSLYGVVSHSFNIRTLFQEKDSSWTRLSDEFNDLAEAYFGTTSWLKAKTLSESAKNTKAYYSLKMSVEYKEDYIKVYCSDFRSGQAFFLRSYKNIKELSGGQATKINDSYYYIEAIEPELIIFYQ